MKCSTMGVVLFVIGSMMGCKCCQPPPPPHQEPIDGTVKYPATQVEPTVFAVKLPHGTDVTKISGVHLWANTNNCEGLKVGQNEYVLDEVQLVKENQHMSAYKIGKIFQSTLQSDPVKTRRATTGSAYGDRDTFGLLDTDQDKAAFDELAGQAAKGTIFFRLVRKQSDPIDQRVFSANVKIDLKK